MFQFDVYVLFFDITVTNYCIKDVFYEPDFLDLLSACVCVCVCVRVKTKQYTSVNTFKNAILKADRRTF